MMREGKMEAKKEEGRKGEQEQATKGRIGQEHRKEGRKEGEKKERRNRRKEGRDREGIMDKLPFIAIETLQV
jgi:hypothetical protein